MVQRSIREIIMSKNNTPRAGFEKSVEKKSHNKDTHPEKGTRRYAQNEKIINENPVLKQARDIAEGLEKPASSYGLPSGLSRRNTGAGSQGQWHGGKGSAPRAGTYSQEYKDNFDRIFGHGKYSKDK